MRWLVCLATLSACGRIGFDALEGDAAVVPTDISAACTVEDCPAGYTRTGSGCYRLAITPASWLDAERACEADGGHLVVEDSIEEHFDVHTFAGGVPQVWVGWSDRRGPDDLFQWVVLDQGGLTQDNACVFGARPFVTGPHCVAKENPTGCPDYDDFDCGLLKGYVCECDGQLGDPSRY